MKIVIGAVNLERCHSMEPSEYLVEFPGSEMRSEMQRRFIARSKLIIPHWEPISTPEYTLDRIIADLA